MTPNEVYPNLETVVNQYISSLDDYSDEQFFFKTDEETWSLGQMYEHLTVSSSFFFLANCLRCLEKRKGQEGGEKNEFGEKLFIKGSFPPIKIKIPEVLRGPEPVAKTRAEYQILLAKILVDSKNLIAAVNNDDGSYKALQPAMGWLDAKEWFTLHEMHYRHHLRQKTALEDFTRQAIND
jgi:DinB superfamily